MRLVPPRQAELGRRRRVDLPPRPEAVDGARWNLGRAAAPGHPVGVALDAGARERTDGATQTYNGIKRCGQVLHRRLDIKVYPPSEYASRSSTSRAPTPTARCAYANSAATRSPTTASSAPAPARAPPRPRCAARELVPPRPSTRSSRRSAWSTSRRPSACQIQVKGGANPAVLVQRRGRGLAVVDGRVGHGPARPSTARRRRRGRRGRAVARDVARPRVRNSCRNR